MITSSLGTLLLFTAAISSFCTLPKSNWQTKFFYTAALTPILSFTLLLYAFITSDMSIKNVFLNSSSILPLIYKISAAWASHEGSILLWITLFSLVNLIYFYSSPLSKQKLLSESFLYQSIFAIIQLLFLITIIYTSNPFEYFKFVPKTGLGLNPMLQDMALSIHPPILYLGNICLAPIFISSIILLRFPEESRDILLFNKKLLNIALSLLTLGIGLGAWWAYRELGWGGYWFFDPVENISLMPWLCAIALYHFLLIYKKEEQNIRSIIFLSVLGFLSVLYGTFIVRSGIISSVHSFAFSPQRGAFIFAICAVATMLPIYFMIHSNLPTEKSTQSLKSRLMYLGNCLWILALAIIIISLIYPIYCYFADGSDISIDVNYFYQVFVPIFIPILLLSAIVPFIDWLKIILFLVLSIVTTIAISHYSEMSYILFMICMGSIFLCLYMLEYLLTKSCYFQKMIDLKHLALFLSHFGFGLLSLSITLNILFTQQIEFSGTVGSIEKSNGRTIKLENIKFAHNDNYYRQIATFKIEDKDHVVILKPENRLYKIENSLSQEVDIFSYLSHDVYAVISRIKDDVVQATIHFQPLISFIWLSVLLMSLGLILPLLV